MKIKIFAALCVSTVLLGGCSSVKFTEYNSSVVVQGKGGAVRGVGDVDFWEDGDPDRKYKILGFIEASHGQRLPLGRFSSILPSSSDNESAIAKAAHKHGGDAVILTGGAQEQSGEGGRSHGSHGQSQKLVVVKYVD